MSNPHKFWMVHSMYGSPTVEHTSEDEAISEAERLALKHPGSVFYVLEAQHAVIKQDTKRYDMTEWFGGQIPF